MRQSGLIMHRHRINMHRPSIDGSCQPQRTMMVTRENRRRQPVIKVLDQRRDVVLVVDGDRSQDRAEGLGVEEVHRGGDAADDCCWEVGALGGCCGGVNGCAFCAAVRDEVLELGFGDWRDDGVVGFDGIYKTEDL